MNAQVHEGGHHVPPHEATAGAVSGDILHGQGATAPSAGNPATGADGKAPKKVREAVNIAMTDGRTVEFVGKTQMLKDVIVIGEGENFSVTKRSIDDLTLDDLGKTHIGQIRIRIDLRNGTTREYELNPALALRFAGHGGLQKYGDQVAGGVKNDDGSLSTDLDDWAYVLDSLHEQLKTGEWSKAREGGGGGISILLQALVRFTGRTLEEVKEFTRDWTAATRQQMMVDPEIKPIIDAINLEKAARASHVDTSALKAGLRSLIKPAAEGEAAA